MNFPADLEAPLLSRTIFLSDTIQNLRIREGSALLIMTKLPQDAIRQVYALAESFLRSLISRLGDEVDISTMNQILILCDEFCRICIANRVRDRQVLQHIVRNFEDALLTTKAKTFLASLPIDQYRLLYAQVADEFAVEAVEDPDDDAIRASGERMAEKIVELTGANLTDHDPERPSDGIHVLLIGEIQIKLIDLLS